MCHRRMCVILHTATLYATMSGTVLQSGRERGRGEIKRKGKASHTGRYET